MVRRHLLPEPGVGAGLPPGGGVGLAFVAGGVRQDLTEDRGQPLAALPVGLGFVRAQAQSPFSTASAASSADGGFDGASLGPVRGVAVQALYIAAAAIGLPFYSEASGGYDVVVGATGGYVVGFIPAAYLIGLAAEHGADRKLWKSVPLFVAGQAVIFAVGVPWLALATGMSASQALEAGFYPFILGGLVKAAVAGAVLGGAWRLTRRG